MNHLNTNIPDIPTSPSSTSPGTLVRWVLQALVFSLVYALCLFLPSGMLRWPGAWVYLAVFFISQAVTGLVLYRSQPALLVKRMHSDRRDALSWDRPLTGIVSLFGPLAILLTAGFEARAGVNASAGSVFNGAWILTGGALLTAWSLAANCHFYGFVRIEKQGHDVVRSGPYAVIRHPGYAGGILFNLATPMLLDAAWAWIPAWITVLALVLRTALEDRYLQQHLPGYREYAAVVRWRLLPRVW